MLLDNKILVGKGENPVYLLPQMANRHGLIAGATGTGKTTTLKVLAEGFSAMGVPVFLADVKGDVSSISLPGTPGEKINSRLEGMGLPIDSWKASDFPVRFWDVFGKGGIPVRATITDVGPMLLSRLLGLSEVQSGVLNIAFHVADDNGWSLIDLKDLRSMLTYCAEHKAELTASYGNVTSQSVGAIQRALLNLQDQGGDRFFGEPQMEIADWFQLDNAGRGYVNILHAVELTEQPLLYATFMLWMLGELYEALPEVGDLDKPRMVFFFDEAHMLFTGAPKAMLEKIVQVVKLIRSKGVGIYFISQSPADIPDPVLAQLNNRIQHALRAYTPAEQKAVRVAAQSFRVNPKFKTEEAISNMGTGVALVSLLDEKGVPCVVEQATICPPQSGFTAMTDAARSMFVGSDPFYAKYKDMVDNVSAYEILNDVAEAEEAERAEAARLAAEEKQALLRQKEEEKQALAEQKAAEKQALAEQKAAEKAEKLALAEQKAAEKQALAEQKAAEKQALAEQKAAEKAAANSVGGKVGKSVKKAAKSTARQFGRNVGKSITRSVLGTTNVNSTVTKYASTLTGSLISDLFSSFFK